MSETINSNVAVIPKQDFRWAASTTTQTQTTTYTLQQKFFVGDPATMAGTDQWIDIPVVYPDPVNGLPITPDNDPANTGLPLGWN